MSFKNKLANFDLFSKPVEPQLVYTTHALGGVVSILTGLIITLLVLGELHEYLTVSVVETIGVDRSFDSSFDFRINVLFPHLSCKGVRLDYVSITGASKENLDQQLNKTKVLSPQGHLRHGCAMEGWLKIPKVSGNLHIALGRGEANTGRDNTITSDVFQYHQVGAQHTHLYNQVELLKMNASHEIHHLSFGECEGIEEVRGAMTTTLNGVKKEIGQGIAQYNYFVSIVPTTYRLANHSLIVCYQYTYTEKVIGFEHGKPFPLPGVFFHLTFSPLTVQIAQINVSFREFLIEVCGIVGSISAVSYILLSSLLTFLNYCKDRGVK